MPARTPSHIELARANSRNIRHISLCQSPSSSVRVKSLARNFEESSLEFSALENIGAREFREGLGDKKKRNVPSFVGGRIHSGTVLSKQGYGRISDAKFGLLEGRAHSRAQSFPSARVGFVCTAGKIISTTLCCAAAPCFGEANINLLLRGNFTWGKNFLDSVECVENVHPR